MISILRRIAIVFSAAVLAIATAHAEVPAEQARVMSLPAPTSHWVWVTDISFPNFVPGKANLYNAGDGRFLGMITMGYGLTALGLPRAGHEIYTVETHYDRVLRGNRVDFVGIYDAKNLKLRQEIVIPSKKVSSVPMLSFVGLTDNDRYLLIYNFTPAQSVSIVDTSERKFVGEIETPGCGLVLPAGDRRFLMLCSDGSMADVRFSASGTIEQRDVTAPLFDPDKEFFTEKAVRYGNTWLFVTNHGEIQPVVVAHGALNIGERWSLFSDDERAQNWRIGGQQHLAVHQNDGLLFVAVHQGGPDTHKDPGSNVFVYDLKSKKRRADFVMQRPASSIQVTQDAAPLLMTTNAYPAIVDIYDARSGEFARQIDDAAVTPMTVQTHLAQ